MTTTKPKATAKAKRKARAKKSKVSPQVGIIMGSDSDLKVMQGAADCLLEFDVPFEIKVVSAHRTPVDMLRYAAEADKRGLQVIIAGAGGAAHLPGMIASATLLPVIGVPVHITKLDGLDALLSVVQMPKGVPVATVAIDNAYNAGLLAVRILAVSEPSLQPKLTAFRAKQVAKVRKANSRLKSLRLPR
jgi:5-(carboxyamino)imidazole ribonucleotide mutase